MKKLKMNLLKLKKYKKRQIEKIYIIEPINIYQTYRTISTFGRDTYNGKITTEEADGDQRDLLVENLNFKKKSKTEKFSKKKTKKKEFLKNYIIFLIAKYSQ